MVRRCVIGREAKENTTISINNANPFHPVNSDTENTARSIRVERVNKRKTQWSQSRFAYLEMYVTK